MIQAKPRSREVIFPVINGQEVNNNPEQDPGREIINFFFHTHGLIPTQVAKVSKKSQEEAEAGYQNILELRRLYRELDEAVRDAYGWYILDLGYDFQEVETLPENDRVRYTISHMARKEVLRRLLALNHQCAVAQAAAPVQKKHGKRGKAQADHSTPEFFDRSYIFMKIYDVMQHAIDRGKPSQTLLAPPPTDPGVTHPPRGKDGSSL